MPIQFARLICQRASLWWDLRQRDRVRAAQTIILTLLVAAVLLIALSGGNTVEQMILAVYVPLAPAGIRVLREILAQGDAVQADERGLSFVESLWRQALDKTTTEPELAQQSLLVQDALYDARSRCPLIFNWVYNSLRK